MLHAAKTTDAPRPVLQQDAEGHNALMQAAAHGHDSIVGLLLEAGVPWNAIDKEGNCAGDLAVAAAHESTAEMLLEAGATRCAAAWSLRVHEGIPYEPYYAPEFWWSEDNSTVSAAPALGIEGLAESSGYVMLSQIWTQTGIRSQCPREHESKLGQQPTGLPHQYTQQQLQCDTEEGIRQPPGWPLRRMRPCSAHVQACGRSWCWGRWSGSWGGSRPLRSTSICSSGCSTTQKSA